jgi:hypothetical protein
MGSSLNRRSSCSTKAGEGLASARLAIQRVSSMSSPSSLLIDITSARIGQTSPGPGKQRLGRRCRSAQGGGDISQRLIVNVAKGDGQPLLVRQHGHQPERVAAGELGRIDYLADWPPRESGEGPLLGAPSTGRVDEQPSGDRDEPAGRELDRRVTLEQHQSSNERVVSEVFSPPNITTAQTNQFSVHRLDRVGIQPMEARRDR